MSDSLNATVIVRCPVSMISAKPVLLEELLELEPLELLEPDPPRLPAELDPEPAVAPVEPVDEPEPAEPDEPAVIASPGETL
jgi:hypothetical protein